MRERFRNLTDEALPSRLYDGLYCLMRHVYHDRGQEVPRGTDLSIGYLKSRPSVCWVNVIEHCNGWRKVSPHLREVFLRCSHPMLLIVANFDFHRSFVPDLLVRTPAYCAYIRCLVHRSLGACDVDSNTSNLVTTLLPVYPWQLSFAGLLGEL